VSSFLLAMVSAIVYLAVTPEYYQARTIMEIGSISVGGKKERLQSGGDVSALMMEPGFVAEVLDRLGWTDDQRKHLFLNSYSVWPKHSNLLHMSVLGLSPQEARLSLAVAADYMTEKHQILRIKKELKQQSIWKSINRHASDLESFFRIFESKSSDMCEGVTLAERFDQINAHHQLIRVYRESKNARVQPNLGVSTGYGEVIAKREPVFPNLKRVCSAALLGSILLSVLLVIIRLKIKDFKKYFAV
jgi:hypothetical protein